LEYSLKMMLWSLQGSSTEKTFTENFQAGNFLTFTDWLRRAYVLCLNWCR
jgi:hypothetical protein